MRDIFAGILALVLLFVATSLATTLHYYRRRRDRTRDDQQALGRRIIAEVPTSDSLVLVTEDDRHFYWGDQSIEKAAIVAVRVLINGAPIAQWVSSRLASAAASSTAAGFEDRPEGIARDRWDVAVETTGGSMLMECGAIRERVSQELARTIFDRLRDVLEERDR